MGHKPDAEDLSEGLHLRGDLSIGSSAVSDYDTGVVDGTPPAGAIHEAEGFGPEQSGKSPPCFWYLP